MPALTKKPITKVSADLRLRVPVNKVETAKEAIEHTLQLTGIEYSISEEKYISWQDAFPEYGPGDALKGARLMEGLTQAQLAEEIGIKPHHISEMEHNKRPIGKKIAKRLARALHTGYKVFL
ncbi:MAG: helix-turn-helix transcriptional regulator [Thermodesulfobacteriota bacterium]|nr:helix-turn-helix transcriptional regulator [Thermodesulfobacteriota bacterium]